MTLQRIEDKDQVAMICIDACFRARCVVVRLRHGVDHGERFFLTDLLP